MTSDHLGSPRIVTDNAGIVISRHDYMAFGDEVTTKLGNVGGRTNAQGYGEPDDVRKQYTGYERDKESGLDYAQARYYNSNHGRFTSVDPLTASASIRNPQTFNRYSYVLNSPYKFSDPLGLLPVTTGANGGRSWCSTCQTSDDNGGYVEEITVEQAQQTTPPPPPPAPVQNTQTSAQQQSSTDSASAIILIPKPICTLEGDFDFVTVAVTVKETFTGIRIGNPDGTNRNIVAPRSELIVTLTIDGRPIEGTLTESVTSQVDKGMGLQPANTVINQSSVFLSSGQFIDYVLGEGYDYSPRLTQADADTAINDLENVDFNKVVQTATFTIKPTNLSDVRSIKVVHNRTLSNFTTSPYVLNKQQGTRYRYESNSLMITINR